MPVHKLSSSGRSRYLGTVFLAINSEHFFAASIADERNENIPEVLLVDESGRTVYGDESLLPDLIDHTERRLQHRLQRRGDRERAYGFKESALSFHNAPPVFPLYCNFREGEKQRLNA